MTNKDRQTIEEDSTDMGDPETVAAYEVEHGKFGVGTLIRWDGGEYEDGNYWIFAEDDSVVSLETAE